MNKLDGVVTFVPASLKQQIMRTISANVHLGTCGVEDQKIAVFCCLQPVGVECHDIV